MKSRALALLGVALAVATYLKLPLHAALEQRGLAEAEVLVNAWDDPERISFGGLSFGTPTGDEPDSDYWFTDLKESTIDTQSYTVTIDSRKSELILDTPVWPTWRSGERWQYRRQFRLNPEDSLYHQYDDSFGSPGVLKLERFAKDVDQLTITKMFAMTPGYEFPDKSDHTLILQRPKRCAATREDYHDSASDEISDKIEAKRAACRKAFEKAIRAAGEVCSLGCDVEESSYRPPSDQQLETAVFCSWKVKGHCRMPEQAN